jgi:hypothetical protein
MKVDKKGNTTILRDTQGIFADFRETVQTQYNSFKDTNLILDITNDKGVSLQDVLTFLELSNKHRKAKKSFVIVASGLDYDEMPDEMVVVPTLQEAHDIIEMEEIERDLGF